MLYYKSIKSSLLSLLNTEKGLLIGETDFDSIWTTGFYDISCTNPPLDEYRWGTLAVLNSGIYATTQIYFPHTPNRYPMVVRTKYTEDGNNMNWCAWQGIAGILSVECEFTSDINGNSQTTISGSYTITSVMGLDCNLVLIPYYYHGSKKWYIHAQNFDGTAASNQTFNVQIHYERRTG